jgi:hypothetical protein
VLTEGFFAARSVAVDFLRVATDVALLAGRLVFFAVVSVALCAFERAVGFFAATLDAVFWLGVARARAIFFVDFVVNL